MSTWFKLRQLRPVRFNSKTFICLIKDIDSSLHNVVLWHWNWSCRQRNQHSKKWNWGVGSSSELTQQHQNLDLTIDVLGVRPRNPLLLQLRVSSFGFIQTSGWILPLIHCLCGRQQIISFSEPQLSNSTCKTVVNKQCVYSVSGTYTTHFGKHCIKLIVFITKQEVLHFQLNMLILSSALKHMTFWKYWATFLSLHNK